MEEVKFFIEYSQTPNLYKKIIREEFQNREQVRERMVELTGTYNKNIQIYIHSWQCGAPFKDTEWIYYH